MRALVAVLALSSVASAVEPVSFIEQIAPIFKENCIACHDAKKRAGKYEMTTFAKLIEEDRIVPTKPDDSEVYGLIVSTVDRRMPPRKDNLAPLSKTQAELVKRWIDEGAKLDPGIDPTADLLKELRIRWKPPTPAEKYAFPAPVNAVVFTPDNKRIIVGGHHELTIRDINDGKLIARLRTRSERAHAMTFLPDGLLAVAGGRPGQEGDVRLYDINAAGKTVNGVTLLDGVNDPKVFRKHLLDVDDSVLCLAVSPDGKSLAAGACDRMVRIWDLSAGSMNAKISQTVENHADMVLSVAFAADGSHLLTSGRDKTAKVWDLTKKESVLTFPEHQQAVWGVAASADSTLGYSAGADKRLRSWKLTGDGKQVKEIGSHSDEVLKLVAHPKEAMLLTASADKTVKVWDLKSGTATKTLTGMNDHIFALAVSPDGKLAAAGGYDGEVRIWTLADGKVSAEFNASPGYVAGKK